MVLALGHRFKPVQTDFGDGISRAWHKYGKTCSVFKMGNTGMGAVSNFGTPWYHMYFMGKLQVSFNIFYFYYHFYPFSSTLCLHMCHIVTYPITANRLLLSSHIHVSSYMFCKLTIWLSLGITNAQCKCTDRKVSEIVSV